MTWDDLQTAIKAWVAACSGLTGIYFENDPRPYVPTYYALLTWVSETGEDSPQVINTDDTDETLTPIVAEQTVLSLQIAVESFEQLAATNARAFLGKLRNRSRLQSNLDLLEASNIAVVSWTPATRGDYVVDGRMVSRWLCEVTLRVQISETATVDETVNTIGSIELSTEIAGEDSILFPTPPNLDNEAM